HVIPGAHYEPWRDRESSQYAFERIPTIADHLHYVGAGDIREGIGSQAEDLAGGGHAHCGTMIYLGDNWPAGYRNTAFLNNIHGKRINNDVLRRSGSGYVASHAPDLLRNKDSWMMGVTLQYGPDGSVYVLDWSDTGECHSVRNTQRETGRIYRIAYRNPEPRRVDVASLSDAQLVALQLHPNDWFVRHARRVLQERFASGHKLEEAIASLQTMLSEQADVTRKLRALWALHCVSALQEEQLRGLLDDPAEQVRAWAVTLLCERKSATLPAPLTEPSLTRLVDLARTGVSPLVRLHLASALQRLHLVDGCELAMALCSRAEDATDQNLPLMYWYGVEPLIGLDGDSERPAEWTEQMTGITERIAMTTQIPLIRRHVARRVAAKPVGEHFLDSIVQVLGQTTADAARRDLLAGLLQGLEGRRTVPMPSGWRYVYTGLSHSRDDDVRNSAVRLALVFEDPEAIRSLQ
ncbi:MAG: hypothetical protein KDA75_22425, partial [Planctomycetaceae bacterium]|nr:hypothetical protein [Planctomycetaceae bacterium]